MHNAEDDVCPCEMCDVKTREPRLTPEMLDRYLDETGAVMTPADHPGLTMTFTVLRTDEVQERLLAEAG